VTAIAAAVSATGHAAAGKTRRGGAPSRERGARGTWACRLGDFGAAPATILWRRDMSAQAFSMPRKEWKKEDKNKKEQKNCFTLDEKTDLKFFLHAKVHHNKFKPQIRY
jgi:hypothetical protein